MEKINKKFAWIVDGSGANSWGVKNDEAIHLKDGTPFIMYWRVIPAKVGKNTKVWIAIQREGSSI